MRQKPSFHHHVFDHFCCECVANVSRKCHECPNVQYRISTWHWHGLGTAVLLSLSFGNLSPVIFFNVILIIQIVRVQWNEAPSFLFQLKCKIWEIKWKAVTDWSNLLWRTTVNYLLFYLLEDPRCFWQAKFRCDTMVTKSRAMFSRLFVV